MGLFIKLNIMKTKRIKIPLNRTTITSKDKNYFKRLIDSISSLNKTVEEFEQKFANYVSRKYAVATNSGTAALHLALLSLNIRPADEVICPSYTCVALLNAINYVKARPKLIDCNFDVKKGDFNISFSDLKNEINSKTKAIIVPHMFGCSAEIDKIISLGVPVIEDATQFLGGSYCGKKSGSFGLISFFSLHSSKMITVGAGGILLTDSKELFEKAKFFADYESTIISQRLKEPNNYQIQYNYKISDLNAILGISQLNQINQFVEKRKKIARIYSQHLKGAAEIPIFFKDNIFWRYIVRTKKDPREIIKEGLRHGIELGRGVYPSLHQYLKMDDELFPNTSKATRSLIALPIYPSLTSAEINYLIKTVKKIL